MITALGECAVLWVGEIGVSAERRAIAVACLIAPGFRGGSQVWGCMGRFPNKSRCYAEYSRKIRSNFPKRQLLNYKGPLTLAFSTSCYKQRILIYSKRTEPQKCVPLCTLIAVNFL